MIIVDYSAIAIANVMIAIKRDNEIFSKDLVLHMIMNSIRKNNALFRDIYGEMVICCDGSKNWRRDVFPPYKYKRRKKRKEDDDIDWSRMYEYIDFAKDALKENFPYKVIEEDRAEADDIIGALARYSTDNKIKTVVISGDKDFVQCHSEYVDQWRPIDESYVQIADPKAFLKELIIRGDSDDGVPNIKSPDDIFMQEGKRQKSIFKKDMEIWLKDDHNTFLNQDDEWKTNFERNKKLIDLNNTPSDIYENIMDKYMDTTKKGNRSLMERFFLTNGLRRMQEQINDFT